VLTALSFRNVSAVYILAALLLVFAVWIPDTFYTETTMRTLFDSQAIVGLVAVSLVIPLAAGVFNLAVGQVIELKATPQSRVRVECNGEPMAWCDLGKSNGTYTLRVDSFIVLYIAFVIGPQHWPIPLFLAVGTVNYCYKMAMAVALIPLLYLGRRLIRAYLEGGR